MKPGATTYHPLIRFADGQQLALDGGMTEGMAQLAAEGVAKLAQEGRAKKQGKGQLADSPEIAFAGAAPDTIL